MMRKLKFKKIITRIISLLVVFAVLLLSSCTRKDVETTTEPDTTEAETIAVSSDIIKSAIRAYNNEFTDFCDYYGIEVVGGAYVFKNTADKVPILAVSTTYYDTHPSPDLVYKYVDGKVVAIYPKSYGTGSTVKDEFWFVDGTDIMVYRYFGNSPGTFGRGEQIIYSDFENGGCSEVTQTFSVDWVYTDDDDITRAQDEMRKQMDAELSKKAGDDFDLISYKDSYVTDRVDKYLYNYIGFVFPVCNVPAETELITEHEVKTAEYYTELYDSQVIKQSRFSSVDEMVEFYLDYWKKNNNGRTASYYISEVDYYHDDTEILAAASLEYIYNSGYTVYDFEDELFYLQVAEVAPGSCGEDPIVTSWLENLFDLFPSDFGHFLIIKAYKPLSKEVVTISSLANGEKAVDWYGRACVTEKIAKLSYDSFRFHYPIHEYFGIKEKSDEEYAIYNVYKEILLKYDNAKNGYTLYDINGDSIDEIVISYGKNGTEGFKCEFYTIKNGKSVFAGETEAENNTYLVIGDDGKIYKQTTRFGYESISECIIENGKLKETNIQNNIVFPNDEYTDLGREMKFISVIHTYMVE